jgi:two-component system, chemotaxis family, protein-glutamate methylesterase/glutaminase
MKDSGNGMNIAAKSKNDIASNQQIKVLICDDSAFLRVTLRKIIESDPMLRVLAIARNGAEAVEKAIRMKPDVITMDINMPVLDGVAALKDIVRLKIAPVIMLSAATRDDAPATFEAMEAGAFDFIAKPSEVDSLDNRAATIIQKIKQAAASNIYRKLERAAPKNSTSTPVKSMIPAKTGLKPAAAAADVPDYNAVALGLSTGGPRSIFNVLPYLPADLNAAVVVIQHMPPAFLTTFAQRLNSKTAMECVESEPGMKLEAGKIYVAKGGYHLKLINRKSGEIVIRQTRDPKHLFMPSVDVVMHSVCDVFHHRSIGVLMTGMGRDGAEAMEHIKNSGGATIAESDETAIVYGMPQEAVKRGAAQYVLPKWDIAPIIIDIVARKDKKRNDMQYTLR